MTNHTGTTDPKTPNERNPRRSAAARPIMIATAVVGGVALAATGATAALGAAMSGDSALMGAPSATESMAVDATGVTAVKVDVDAAEFTLEFGDVSRAELALEGPRSDRWSLDRNDDVLMLRSHEQFWDFCFGWCRTDAQTVILTLPESLEESGVDVDISLSAGDVRTSGEFDRLGLDMGAGRAVLGGEARSLDLSLGAGSATVDLANVETASFDVSAGSTRGRLTGDAPRRIDIDVSAGSLELGVPDAVYRVDSEVSAGSFDNQLRTASNSSRQVSVEVSAGRATLTPSE